MKSVELGQARLEGCVADAQQEKIVVTRNGKPVALVIGLDEEQQQLGSSQRFWDLVAERRRQPTVSRAELEQRFQKGRCSGKRYLANNDTREVHDLENEKNLCQINEIKEEHIAGFATLQAALSAGYDRCAFCVGDSK